MKDFQLPWLWFAILDVESVLLDSHFSRWFQIRRRLYLEVFSDAISVILQRRYYIFGILLVNHLKLKELLTCSIKLFQLGLPVCNNRFENPVQVEVVWVLLHLFSEVWVLFKYLIVQVTFLEAIALWVFLGFVYEVALLVMNSIIIAYYLGACLPFTDLERPVPNRILLSSVPNTNLPIQYEVHLVDHVKFVVYYAVVLYCKEPPGQQSLCY